MPEIGEVARVVHYLRKHLVNRTIKACQPFEDDIVYGKVGCSASAFQKAVEGKKVLSAGQQGKYFYLTFDSPPQSVLHLGMTGWIKFSTEETGYYKQAKKKDQPEEWPPNPKWTKFLLKCEAEKINGEDREALEVAFVDPRRLARIRLVDCEADQIRDHTPLKENGPDPVVDKDKVTVEWLSELLGRKKVPVKALMLDQANISGVGNWVADEILYQARIHPEQYCNTFADAEVKRLHDALIDVCTTACETLADSTQFPDTWLMRHRWDKGKKDGNVLPNGNKITHITVGGRTSAVVPAVQKKTGAVAGDVSSEEDEKPARGQKRKSKVEEDEDLEEEAPPPKKERGKKVKVEKPQTNGEVEPAKKRGRGKSVKQEPVADVDEDAAPVAEEEKQDSKPSKGKKARAIAKKDENSAAPGSRRSARTKSK